MTPPRPRAASVPRARPPSVAQTRAPRPPRCTHRCRRGLRGGAASSPAFPFTFFFFFFFAFGREKNRVFDSALFMFLLGNKRWLCVCVFSCVGFLKKWEEEKKKLPSLSSLLLPPPPSVFPTPLLPPFLFCCFVLLRVHIPVCNPWFARFSVFSKVSLRQLGSLPPSSPAGACRAGLGLARTLPFPLLASFPSSLRPYFGGEPASGRGLAHLARSERHLGAPRLGADSCPG